MDPLLRGEEEVEMEEVSKGVVGSEGRKLGSSLFVLALPVVTAHLGNSKAGLLRPTWFTPCDPLDMRRGALDGGKMVVKKGFNVDKGVSCNGFRFMSKTRRTKSKERPFR